MEPEYLYVLDFGGCTLNVIHLNCADKSPDDFETTDEYVILIIEEYKTAGEKIGVYPISENAWMDMGQLDEMEEMIKRLESDG